MAITVDWGNKIINVPQSDLSFVSGTLYSLDTDVFRHRLDDLMDDAEGIPFLTTHNHNTEITIAGVTYARTIEIINGYTVTFGDGQYAVRLDGSNNNLFDEGIINRNQVSVIPTNSAGLQIVTSGSGLSAAEQQQLDEVHGQVSRSIYLDTTSGVDGDGYQQTPYNIMASALSDANTNTIRKIHVRGTTTILSGANISDIEFFGQSMLGSTITVQSNVTSNVGTQFHTSDVQGLLSSSVVFQGCLIRNISVGRLVANQCLIAGTITVQAAGSPSASETSQFINCRDGSVSSPIFDFGTTTHDLNLKDYIGNITLINMTVGDAANINVQTGQITIDASCSGGSIVVKGIGTLVNNASNVVVDDENFIYDAGNNSFGGMG